MTKAKTIEASKKLRNRWPFQKLRVSDAAMVSPGAVARDGVEPFGSSHCSVSSASSAPAMFRAVDPHISHVLYFYTV